MLTYNELPKAIDQLSKDVADIKRLLLQKAEEHPNEADRWFDLEELCDYLP